jgi:hypothetical protein
LPGWATIPVATFTGWKKNYGRADEYNGWIPRDNWLTDDEKQAILKFHYEHPPAGYRRLQPRHSLQCPRADVLRQRGKESRKGRIERYHRTIRSQCIRPSTPLTIDDVKRAVTSIVDHYNQKRLHSAIGCVTPPDMLEGRQKAIHDGRDRRLEDARRQVWQGERNLNDLLSQWRDPEGYGVQGGRLPGAG